jgi:hypothetical protein
MLGGVRSRAEGRSGPKRGGLRRRKVRVLVVGFQSCSIECITHGDFSFPSTRSKPYSGRWAPGHPVMRPSRMCG